MCMSPRPLILLFDFMHSTDADLNRLFECQMKFLIASEMYSVVLYRLYGISPVVSYQFYLLS